MYVCIYLETRKIELWPGDQLQVPGLKHNQNYPDYGIQKKFLKDKQQKHVPLQGKLCSRKKNIGYLG